MMMLRIGMLCITTAVTCMSFVTYGNSNSNASKLQEHMQHIADSYYQKYSGKELFTAVAMSVYVPLDKTNGAKDSATVVTGTMGFAPYTRKITSDDLFDSGSITKSFTALILLQLQTEGKLSLNDTIGKWLPQYPHWKQVRLRQLLNMTSAIPNYSEDPLFNQKMLKDLAHVWTDEELLTYAHPEKPLKINQKHRYEYSNSNYILASLVIEKATQDTFEHQLSQRILQAKNHLNDTFYLAGPKGTALEQSLKDRRVHGYFYDKKTGKSVDTLSNNLSWAGAAGAVVANTEDVVRWVQLLYHGTLIDPAYKEQALAEMEALVSTQTGQPISAVTANDVSGFGLGIAAHYDNKSKKAFWFYEGSTLGFRVMYLWSACNDVTTVVALNSKGAEGNIHSKMGDHIAQANFELYQMIMKLYPQLNCN